MKRKMIGLLLTLVLAFTLMPSAIFAAYTLPASIGAPEGFALTYYEAHNGDYMGFNVTTTASKELRKFLDDVETESSGFQEAGYTLTEENVQMDFKTDKGNWHETADWDSNYTTQKAGISLKKGTYTSSACYLLDQVKQISESETVPDSTTYFDKNTWQVRIRFMVVVQQADNGDYTTILSPWTSPISFSNKKTVEDPAKLINHVPVLKSAEVLKYADNRPYLRIVSDPPHADVTHLNTITGNSMNTEAWIRISNGEWKLFGGDGNFVEQFDVDAITSLFGNKADAADYQVKIRYKFDYIHYPEAGKSGTIYSPFSNIITHGLGGWSNASQWAATELERAEQDGLIPDSLKGADLTKQVTRAEFAAISVKLYEKLSGKTLAPSAKNPFIDSKDKEVLKAYGAGIAVGISATKFQPNSLVTREEAATMLVRVLKKVKIPGWTFATDTKYKLDFKMPPKLTDDAKIASWAKESVYFMIANGIISGTNDNAFKPQQTASAKDAAAYTSATREQALVLSLRFVEKMGNKQVPYKKVS